MNPTSGLTSIAIGLLLLITGCATSHLPRHAQLVGGGVSIDWQPPMKGTAILLERTSGKIVTTRSVEPPSTNFDFRPEYSEQDAEVLKTLFGTVPPDAKFDLYFVPSEDQGED